MTMTSKNKFKVVCQNKLNSDTLLFCIYRNWILPSKFSSSPLNLKAYRKHKKTNAVKPMFIHLATFTNPMIPTIEWGQAFISTIL